MPPRTAIETNVKSAIRDLRRISPAAAREARAAMKSAAGPVVEQARRDAPRDTGALARSIRATTNRDGVVIRAGTSVRVPYANVIHWGWRKRGIAPNPFLARAIEERAPDALDELVENFNRLFYRHGFKR